MQMASRTSADVISDALLAGDMSVLWDALPTVDASSMDLQMSMKLQPYKQLLYDLIKSRRDRLTREELFIIYNYNVGNVPNSPYKLTLYLKHHGLTIKDLRIGSKTVKGTYVTWRTSEEWFSERKAEIDAEMSPRLKVVPPSAATGT
jgi:hypothetical protein